MDQLTRIQSFALQPQIHLALDKAPFLGDAKYRHQFLEQRGIRRVVFEPGQEIEGLAEVAAVIELAGDGGEVFQATGDVVRLLLKIRRRSSWVRSHHA